MGRDGHGLLAGDVAGGLLGAVLDDEAAETTEIHGLAGDDGSLHHLGELFDHAHDLDLLDAGGLGNFVDDICFSNS